MWRPVVPVAPVAEPLVSFESAAAELRLDELDEADAHRVRVTTYLRAAEGHVQKMTGLQLAEQLVDLRATDWTDLEALPIAPVSDVVSITFVDGDGQVQTLDPGHYDARLEGLEPVVCMAAGISAWPERQAGTLITIRATAGYGTEEADAPGEAVSSVLLLVRALNDTGVFDGVARTVEALLTNYRIHVA